MAVLLALQAALALLLAYAAYLYVKRCLYWRRALAFVRGPEYSLPLLGDCLRMVGPASGTLTRGLRLLNMYGPGPVKFWLSEYPWVHLIRPEDVERLLSSSRQVDKPEVVYGPVTGFFGRGLITLSGAPWMRHRRLLTPAFHFKVLERYADTFTRRAGAFADKVSAEQEHEGLSFDFFKYTSTFVTDTIMETAFGVQDELSVVELHAKDEFIQAADDSFNVIMHRVLKPWLMVDFLFKLSYWGGVQARADRVIHDYAKKVITLKKQEILREISSRKDDTESDDTSCGVREKHTFLDMVLNPSSDQLSDDEIINEVRTLIAVQQTTATTLGFVAVMLALHPHEQQLAREEVLRVDAEAGLPPLERLNRLKYLERVLKETMRLYPITSVFSRTLVEGLKLPDVAGTKGGVLPPGTGVTMFVYGTHRDPRHWPEPERFDPDRFLPERCAGRHPFAYVPFSAGPRNCIGQRYAMLQMKAVTAAVLRRLHLLPGRGCEDRHSLKLNINTFLHIQGGFSVRVRSLPA